MPLSRPLVHSEIKTSELVHVEAELQLGSQVAGAEEAEAGERATNQIRLQDTVPSAEPKSRVDLAAEIRAVF